MSRENIHTFFVAFVDESSYLLVNYAGDIFRIALALCVVSAQEGLVRVV